MKKLHYTELSNKKCKHCGRYLKKNLLVKNPDADLCYKCYKAEGKNE